MTARRAVLRLIGATALSAGAGRSSGQQRRSPRRSAWPFRSRCCCVPTRSFS